MSTRTDYFKLLCDMGELSQLFTDTQNLEAFLQKVVETVSEHMQAPVCSIYMYDEASQFLSIRANKGLNPKRYRDVTLNVKEGLVGKTLRELTPVCLERASESPDYKFFPGLDEEYYDAFLAVPIRQGLTRIGVLVVQRQKEHLFKEQDVSALQTIASQLATILSNVSFLINVGKPLGKIKEELFKKLKFIKGKVAAPGYALGKSKVVKKENPLFITAQRRTEKTFTIEEFKNALNLTQQQLQNLQEKVEEKLSDVASLIFTSHLLMLKDESFIGEMMDLIRKGTNPPEAILTVGKKYMEIFSASPSPLIQEKRKDMEDLLTRLLSNLLSEKEGISGYFDRIVIARDLYPSEILKLSSENVRGIILTSGGVTSHLSILARSLQIPMVIVDRPEFLDISDDAQVLMDAELGNVYLDPTENVIKEFEKQKVIRENILKDKDFLKKPTIMLDGTRVNLLSNINLLADLKLAQESYSDGIGLYRTEFPFIIRADFPSEEEQYAIYCKLVAGMPKKPVTFRTLDLGGDKLFAYGSIKEQNPFLGFRSIRFSLQHKEVFIQQIRAILRASVRADLRIMFPMISSIDEFLEAKNILEQCQRELQREGIPYNQNPKIGIMVEVPSIIDLLSAIAQEVDFFSIGTNDLIQFVLAVDRTNEKVASFYNPMHPSILRILKRVMEIATENGVEVSVCGDMAHTEKYIPFLLGIGLRSLSVDPLYIPKIKKSISQIDLKQAENLAQTLLRSDRVYEIEKILLAFFTKK